MLDTTRDARKTFRWFILAFLLSMVVLVSGAGIFFFEGLDHRGSLAHSSWRSGAMFILTLALLLAAATSAIAFALYQRAQRRHIEGQLSDVRRGIRERDTTLKLLHLLNQRSSTHELIQGIAELIREWMGCDAVGVRLHEGEDYPYAETSGLSPEFVRKERYLCERDSQGRLKCDCDGNPVLDCMCGTVLRGATDPARPFFTAKGSFWTNCTTELLAATTEEDRQGRTRNTCNTEGYESAALIPLRCGGETLGLLQINDRARNRFTPEHISFLEGAADSIAISLAQRQAQAELKE
ncbi:MAG: GAF domain-containing protein, partial [Spirochaetia bacterium]